jgi:flagellar motility protein MotE (MotC chaperone)
MIALARNFRLVPIVVFATASLFVLKTLGILLDGGFALGPDRSTPPPASAARPHARSTAPAPAPQSKISAVKSASFWERQGLDDPEFTGEIGTQTTPGDADAATAKKAAKTPSGESTASPVSVDSNPPQPSAGERTVLESLNKRRQELEARARDLDMRESLLAAAEKRIEARLGELKDVEARLNAGARKHDDMEAAQFKGLVTMYENMRPKDAAKIFDRLDLKIQVDLVAQMNPRKMSDILAQMSAEAAERLTTEIARRSGSSTSENLPSPADLPKIEGRPSGS